MQQPEPLNSLLLRPFPSTPYDTDRLTRLERLDIIINNLEQSQKDVKERIILQALAEKEELDKTIKNQTDIVDQQPNLAALRSRWRPKSKDEKPPDARVALREFGHSLFVEQESHAALAKETAAKLEAYAKGTPAALEKFYKVRERIRREEKDAEAARNGGGTSGGALKTGDAGAGGPTAQLGDNALVEPVAAPGYDASRDPRRRR